MDVTQTSFLPILTEEDIVKVRLAVRLRAVEMRFGIVDQTKIVTAASELARNTLVHGGGGKASISTVTRESSFGIKLDFVDDGPGIPNVKLALTDGYSTGQGLGLGLS